MARGSSQSDFSRSLRSQAEALKDTAESKQREAGRNQEEYQRALNAARARAQAEVDEEFKGKPLAADVKEELRQAALLGMTATTIERLEEENRQKWQPIEAGYNKASNDLITTFNKYVAPGPFGSKEWSDRPNKAFVFGGLNPTREFRDKWIKNAPESIREAVTQLFGGIVSDKVDVGLSQASRTAYAEASKQSLPRFGSGSEKDEDYLRTEKVPGGKEHKAGIKNIERLQKYMDKAFAAMKPKDNYSASGDFS